MGASRDPRRTHRRADARSAGVFRAAEQARGVNGDWLSEIHSGFVGNLSEDLQSNSRVVSIQIGTGQYCNFDTTAIFYPRGESQQPAAIVNAHNSYESGSFLVDLKAYFDPTSGEWTIASGWFGAYCTSTFRQATLRIDRSGRNLVRKVVPARILGGERKDIRIQIESKGRMIRFDYTDTNPDSWITQFPATTIVEIVGDRIRETELARNLAGFIGRALERESKDWAGFDWIAAAYCGPDTREISVRKDSRTRVLRINGRAKNSATLLRLASFTDTIEQFTSGCRVMTTEEMQKELFSELSP